jgi:molybdenum cofactor cytidylyltransferase
MKFPASPAANVSGLAAAILSAGESRRMGRPKALLPYRGRTFLEHLLEITRHPRIAVQRVILGAGAEDILAHLALDPANVVINSEWPLGQLSSIQAAVRGLPGGTVEGLLVCPVDHPLISAGLVAALVAAFDSGGMEIVVPTYNGKRGHPVLFRAALFDELLAAPANLGARAVVWAHAAGVLEVPTTEEGVTLNLNDPATLEGALRLP